jgi:hypothetical protein
MNKYKRNEHIISKSYYFSLYKSLVNVLSLNLIKIPTKKFFYGDWYIYRKLRNWRR